MKISHNKPLHEAAIRVRDAGIFLGGTIGTFESHGRDQFARLIRQGLNPHSRLLDIGCGCLRGGYWTIRFLEAGCYCGIEPNAEMLAAGKAHVVGPDLIAKKEPAFDHNDQFDLSVFGTGAFDFFMAGSIWTHATLQQIGTMMDGFATYSHGDSVFLGSFIRTDDADHTGDQWVGKSHQSNEAGLVSYRFETLTEMAAARHLELTHLNPNVRGAISWLRMSHAVEP